MRNWIKLLESVTVPSFIERVTDDLLDEMLSTGKWVDHGGDLDDGWDMGYFEDYMPDEMKEQTYDEVKGTPEFRNALHEIVKMMANSQYESLTQGDKYEDLPPLGPDTKIYRGITGNLRADGTVGVFWSQVQEQSLGRFIDEKKGGLLMVALVKDVTIDWDATIRSRLDYSNGGDEHEIQLKRGTPVKAKFYRVEWRGATPSSAGRRHLFDLGYDTKKA
jgi:hypothetical protein